MILLLTSPPPLLPSLTVLSTLDLLVEVARHTLSLPDVEALACTCRAASGHGDLLYRAVALAWWGSRFWEDALHRTTNQVFRSMHHELFRMHRFEQLLLRTGSAPWGEAQYRQWWRHDARVCR